jgi:hypothetical protein
VASAQAVPSSSTATQDQPGVARGSKLLLMVADPREGTRSISEAIARSDLSNLWRGRLLSLDEVTANLFLATFRTEGDSMSVIRGQRWTLRNNNLLIELYVQGRATNQYAFQFLEANVRFYGIPGKFRTEHHISRIVQMIGHPLIGTKLILDTLILICIMLQLKSRLMPPNLLLTKYSTLFLNLARWVLL